MVNEKLILETLANHTNRLASLQLALAGLTAVVESHLPNISPEQRVSLQNEIDVQRKDAETLKSSAERLQQALKDL